MTERACSKLCTIDGQGNKVEVEKLRELVSELEKKLGEVQHSYWYAIELHIALTRPQLPFSPPAEDGDGKPKDSITYTRLATMHLGSETLDKLGIEKMPDEARPPPS